MNNPKKRYYFANWKSYQSLVSVKKFISARKRDIDNCGYQDEYIGIAASYEHLYFLHTKMSSLKLHLGAQDISPFMPGAYTSQVSLQSLQEMQISFSIIGHSEVRHYYGESDTTIASKFKLLLAANITPILCIGDTLSQRNDELTLQVLYDQLEAVLIFLQSYIGNTKIFIAYEPIYAIGTGIIAKQQDLKLVFSFLKDLVKELPVAKNIMFLYGGSVSRHNVTQLHNIDEISGFLIGKSSIDFQELKKIVQSDNRT